MFKTNDTTEDLGTSINSVTFLVVDSTERRTQPRIVTSVGVVYSPILNERRLCIESDNYSVMLEKRCARELQRVLELVMDKWDLNDLKGAN